MNRKSAAIPDPTLALPKILVEDYLRETREVLEYAEAINTLIKIVVTEQHETPEATEEQRKQVEVLSESQREILARLNDLTKKALGATQVTAGKTVDGDTDPND